MSTQFAINGATLALTPDPERCPWFDEGDDGRTHTGNLQSQATSGVEVRWSSLSGAQFEEIYNLYMSFAAGGAKVTSLKVIKRGTLATYQVYNQIDTNGIWPDMPEGDSHREEGGIRVRNVVWKFKRVKWKHVA